MVSIYPSASVTILRVIQSTHWAHSEITQSTLIEHAENTQGTLTSLVESTHALDVLPLFLALQLSP